MFALAGLCAVGGAAYRGSALIDLADRELAAHGVRADQVSVRGHRNVLLDDVFGALSLDDGRSLISYDTEAARRRLAELPWIETAAVRRTLPSSLDITVTEREPFAIWQNRQMLFLIDAKGNALQPVSPSEHADLVHLVGEGANAHASELVALVSAHPLIARRFKSAVRIADRRWTLDLTDGISILLPEDGAESALRLVEALHKQHQLLDRAVATVDLRDPRALVLTPTPEAIAFTAEQAKRVAAEAKSAAKPDGGA